MQALISLITAHTMSLPVFLLCAQNFVFLKDNREVDKAVEPKTRISQVGGQKVHNRHKQAASCILSLIVQKAEHYYYYFTLHH